MRDDFDQRTKEVLFKRARGRCSNPECRHYTSGAHSDPDKAINIGFAAHITAAAPGGPRYDPALSAAQRKATDNGIWLCGTCAKLIDSDPQRYTVELLLSWKQTAEAGDEREAAPVSAPSGLPRAVAFVGRAETLAELLTDLRTGGAVGVFALAGMGGVGKTALAAEAVARLAEEPQIFPGGAAWVACEDLRGAEGLAEVWTRVARALDALEVAALPDAEQRRGALHGLLARAARRLLALDNVDGLEAGPLLETLAVQGHTTLLLTARQVIDLPGLVARSLDSLPQAEAETLFREILKRSSQRLRPAPIDEGELPGLVAELGGLPLAIELAATYAGRQGLALATVRQEIAQDGLQAAPFLPPQNPAQRALVLRFDRSWQALALTPHRQQFFVALSLLAGDSFPRAAALALAKTAGGEQATEASALGDLAALVEYALVEALSGERLRLHPLLREYAAGRLKTLPQAQQERLGGAMVAYWLAYAQAHHGYGGMDALEAEASGLLGALEWGHIHARYQELLALAESVAIAWYVRGRRAEELRIAVWAAQAAEAVGDPKRQQWATHYLAVTLAAVGRLEEARAGYERALELARQIGDQGAELAEVHDLAELERRLGRLEVARTGFHRTLELAQQLHNPAAERLALHQTALLDAQTGRLLEARVGYVRALELAQQMGDLAAEQRELHALAALDYRAGQLSEARAGVERALDLAKQLGDLAAEQLAVHDLAVLNGQTGRFSEARSGHERALDLARQLGDPSAESVELANFGLFLCKHGETARGRELVEQSLVISERLNTVQHIGKCHQFLGWIEEQRSNHVEAIAHYREALRCFEQVEASEAEAVRAELRAWGEQT